MTGPILFQDQDLTLPSLQAIGLKETQTHLGVLGCSQN